MADETSNHKEPQEPFAGEAGLARNTISFAGMLIAVVSLANILFLFIVDAIAGHPNPYVGILAYMIFPGFLSFGLLLIPAGMLRERQRRLRHPESTLARFPRLDLNDPRQRQMVEGFAVFLVIFVMLSAVGSYRAYEFTDSIEFCGQLCHSVMHPEFTAYQFSPHARVRCVDCHVGPGAGWYVRSKMSGLRQVFKTALGTYPRPVPSPVANLRPAQDTCEQCHWPEKFHGAQFKTFEHFASDEQNTNREIQMLIKTGGGNPNVGMAQGIHWHMNIANEVTYIASDDKRQEIPWIQTRDKQGRTTFYKLQGKELTQAQIDQAPKRRMDCVDCHNRPSHIYPSPDRSVDQSMAAGRIDRTLPFAKQQAVAILAVEYPTTEKAMDAIAAGLNSFYQQKYPDIYKQRNQTVKATIDEVQRIYRSSIFPDMKINWRTHTDNIGHLYFNGCFRCHDGQHVDNQGRALTKACNVCHEVIAQREGERKIEPKDGTFTHPVDLGDMTQVNCSDCHTGGPQ